MHFDDRLRTVLQLQDASPALARIQFLQLIDLLGAEDKPLGSSPVLDAAFARLEALATIVPARDRAAVLRAPSLRLSNPTLVARLTLAEPDVASAAIAAAQLAEADWLALIPALPVRARGMLRHRGSYGPRVDALLEALGINNRALPPAAMQPSVDLQERARRPGLVVLEGGAAATAHKPARDEPAEAAGIGAIVRKIEAFRRSRVEAVPEEPGSATSRALVAGQARAAILALDFTTDTQGRIDWSDCALASALVGTRLDDAGEPHATAALLTAIRRHQPLRGASLVLSGAPALAGGWRIDALPRFSKPDGRFIGYAGRLRRSAESAAGQDRQPDASADTMREVLHELRTPANAIQVAAEIIQQQLYGPAPHEYRALAAAIAGDTAQILAGFEELDRLVRLESGALVPPSGESDLGPLLFETVARLRAWTTPRGSGFTLPGTMPHLLTTMAHDDADRLVWRLLAALAGASRAGETLAIACRTGQDGVEVSIDVPSSLTDRLDEAAHAGQPIELVRSLSAGIFGAGFTFRLARAEAAAAGGALLREGARFRLILPGLTPAAAGHTQA